MHVPIPSNRGSVDITMPPPADIIITIVYASEDMWVLLIVDDDIEGEQRVGGQFGAGDVGNEDSNDWVESVQLITSSTVIV